MHIGSKYHLSVSLTSNNLYRIGLEKTVLVDPNNYKRQCYCILLPFVLLHMNKSGFVPKQRTAIDFFFFLFTSSRAANVLRKLKRWSSQSRAGCLPTWRPPERQTQKSNCATVTDTSFMLVGITSSQAAWSHKPPHLQVQQCYILISQLMMFHSEEYI